MANNMTHTSGGFCNHVIRAYAASFIAKKRGLSFCYGEFYPKMKQLGIELYTSGTNTYDTQQHIDDNNVMACIHSEDADYRNIFVNYDFFQTAAFSLYLYEYYRQSIHQQSIIDANVFKERYRNNEDLFVHIRLGDVTRFNPGLAYYDKFLSSHTFQKGYISSDSITHDICQQLIAKYNLTVIDYDDVETIMFASTCRYILLTSGSYSYIIGLFGFFSTVFYIKQTNAWCPADLYRGIKDWTEIDL